MACSVCCFPHPLELSNLILSRSSSIYQTSCDGVYSSSTIIGSISYFDVWISSTSTTIGVAFSLVSVARAVLHVFLPALPVSPMRGGDISMRSSLEIYELNEFSVEFLLYLSSTRLCILSLEIDTMTRFPPLSLTL
jgi:hypothetical protein